MWRVLASLGGHFGGSPHLDAGRLPRAALGARAWLRAPAFARVSLRLAWFAPHVPLALPRELPCRRRGSFAAGGLAAEPPVAGAVFSPYVAPPSQVPSQRRARSWFPRALRSRSMATFCGLWQPPRRISALSTPPGRKWPGLPPWLGSWSTSVPVVRTRRSRPARTEGVSPRCASVRRPSSPCLSRHRAYLRACCEVDVGWSCAKLGEVNGSWKVVKKFIQSPKEYGEAR